MLNCSICGAHLTDQDSNILSKDLDDCFICAHCAAQLRSIRRHAKTADPKFENDIDRLVSDIDSYPNIEDPVLMYLSTFIRYTRRVYKDACLTRESGSAIHSLKKLPHTDSRFRGNLNAKSMRSRILKPMLIVAGIIVGIVAIILVAGHIGSAQEIETSISSSVQSDPAIQETTEIKSDYTPPYVTAFGNFSEGKAFAFVDNRPCYVDEQGNVVFFISDGWFGHEFSEGYAVITNLNFKGMYVTNSTLLNAKYELIDAEGNTVFSEDMFDFIGKMSQGKCFTYKKTENYDGTVYEYVFRDVQGNAIVSVDSIPLEDLLSLDEIYYNEDEYVAIVNRGVMQYYCSTYNLAGEKVSSFPYGGVVGTLSDVIHSRYMYSASNRSFDILDRYTEESTTIPCQGYIEMPVNGRTLCWGDNVLSLIDLNGSVIKERQLDVKHVYPTDTTRWILSLQNDYYAIVDETLEFLFEPIQKRITYVGENMFLIGADVTNANGEVLFSLPQYNEVISGLHEFYFYNGIAIVNLSDYYDQSAPLNCPYRYIRNDGEVLFNG